MTAPPPEAPLGGELREALVAAMQRVPELAGRDLILTALSGGITNRNFRVDADGGLAAAASGGETYVIRLGATTRTCWASAARSSTPPRWPRPASAWAPR